jgi:ankyrin repeat protein
MVDRIHISIWKDKIVRAASRMFGQRKTRIFLAVHDGRRDTVKRLLGVAPQLTSARDESGWTLLHLAAFHGDYRTSELLVEAGADVNAVCESGTTPLHKATVIGSEGSEKVVELLIAHGAKVNVEDQGGNTPLHESAWRGYEHIVTLLLSHGADVNARDRLGKTPLDLAVANARRVVVENLLRHGAKYLGDPMKELEQREWEIKHQISAPLVNPSEERRRLMG